MSNVFVTKSDLSLKAGKYLVSGTDETPVYHEDFVALQVEADMLVSLATKVKDVDFTVKAVKSFDQYVQEVTKEKSASKVSYVDKIETVTTPTVDALKAEALAWITGNSENEKVDKINNLMQKFNLLKEFEDFGLYFSKDKIVTLSKIYTIAEITAAITVLEPNLKA